MDAEERRRKSRKRARGDLIERNSETEDADKKSKKKMKVEKGDYQKPVDESKRKDEKKEKKRKTEEKKEENLKEREGEKERLQITQPEEEEKREKRRMKEETSRKGRKKGKKKKRKEGEIEEQYSQMGKGYDRHEHQHQHEKENVDNREENMEDPAALEVHAMASAGPISPSSDLDQDRLKVGTVQGKKRQQKNKKVTFDDRIAAAEEMRVRDAPIEARVSDRESFNESGYIQSLKDDADEIWGVRFSPEEDEILKNAVWTYIRSKGWDENVGLERVLNSKQYKEARDCWTEIKLSLPHRPQQAVRRRARLLLEPGTHLGRWSKEEEALLRRLQNEQGSKWKEMSKILNRHRTCIKEKWRSLKRNGKRGRGGWAQDELQQLSDMVNKSLKLNRLQAERKDKIDRHLLRDNIPWEVIADTLGTHDHGACCGKWYYHLQSSLVADGKWSNQDDFLLLKSLLESGASTEEEVDWNSLLEHRKKAYAGVCDWGCYSWTHFILHDFTVFSGG
ncbi:hypothetical protein KP509_38G041200 [Ceratopteris richardii]|uniref:Uncharacterized protein n=1 Tax=Ceratopteris richardii TaxID=49495 RepID=A0A8T2Q3W7_CERRI|nr:hypothetical protein KP509_38G041200 [Ceratopteris richardii]